MNGKIHFLHTHKLSAHTTCFPSLTRQVRDRSFLALRRRPAAVRASACRCFFPSKDDCLRCPACRITSEREEADVLIYNLRVTSDFTADPRQVVRCWIQVVVGPVCIVQGGLGCAWRVTAALNLEAHSIDAASLSSENLMKAHKVDVTGDFPQELTSWRLPQSKVFTGNDGHKRDLACLYNPASIACRNCSRGEGLSKFVSGAFNTFPELNAEYLEKEEENGDGDDNGDDDADDACDGDGDGDDDDDDDGDDDKKKKKMMMNAEEKKFDFPDMFVERARRDGAEKRERSFRVEMGFVNLCLFSVGFSKMFISSQYRFFLSIENT
eukprot:751895-Hanusia_phi.AAC.2